MERWGVRCCPVIVVVVVVVGRRRLVVVVRSVVELTTKGLGRRGRRNSCRRDGCVMESTRSRLGRRWRVHRCMLWWGRDIVQSARCGLWWVGGRNGVIILRWVRRRRHIVQSTRLRLGRRWRSILWWVGRRRVWCIVKSTRSGLGRGWWVNTRVLGRRGPIVQSTRSRVSLSLYSWCRNDTSQLSALVDTSCK